MFAVYDALYKDRCSDAMRRLPYAARTTCASGILCVRHSVGISRAIRDGAVP